MNQLILTLSLCFISLTSVGKNSDKVKTIDLDNIKSTKVAKVSDMLKNPRIVRLETKNNVLLKESTEYVVCDKYIVSHGYHEDLHLFNRDGKFIKTLARHGRGPLEIRTPRGIDIDNKNDLLYLNHGGSPDKIFVYDLDRAKLIRTLKVDKISLGNLIVLNESKLALLPRFDKSCSLVCINSKTGKVISKQVDNSGNKLGFLGAIGYNTDKLYYSNSYVDTLYTINNTSKKELCYFDFEYKLNENKPRKVRYLRYQAYGKNFMLIKMNPVTFDIRNGSVWNITNHRIGIEIYWFDISKLSISKITEYYNDILGFKDDYSPWWDKYLHTKQKFGHIAYSAIELKGKLEKVLKSDNISVEVKNRVTLLNNHLNIGDNPVLIIGEVK